MGGFLVPSMGPRVRWLGEDRTEMARRVKEVREFVRKKVQHSGESYRQYVCISSLWLSERQRARRVKGNQKMQDGMVRRDNYTFLSSNTNKMGSAGV